MTSSTRQESSSRSESFQWNAGGWFGSQLGSTCWMLIAGILVLSADPAAGAGTLACFAAANGVGLAMWARRDRLRAYPAIQALIVVVGLASLAATFVLDRAGQLESLGTGTSAATMYVVLGLMTPGLLLWFHVMERENRQGDRTGRRDEDHAG